MEIKIFTGEYVAPEINVIEVKLDSQILSTSQFGRENNPAWF